MTKAQRKLACEITHRPQMLFEIMDDE